MKGFCEYNGQVAIGKRQEEKEASGKKTRRQEARRQEARSKKSKGQLLNDEHTFVIYSMFNSRNTQYLW
jgi:hypothetical protein